jgi:hypothetical protein
LLLRKAAAKVIVSHFPSGTWPILEVISKPREIKDSGARSRALVERGCRTRILIPGRAGKLGIDKFAGEALLLE